MFLLGVNSRTGKLYIFRVGEISGLIRVLVEYFRIIQD